MGRSSNICKTNTSYKVTAELKSTSKKTQYILKTNITKIPWRKKSSKLMVIKIFDADWFVHAILNTSFG